MNLNDQAGSWKKNSEACNWNRSVGAGGNGTHLYQSLLKTSLRLPCLEQRQWPV
jgi:hypothetical protein